MKTENGSEGWGARKTWPAPLLTLEMRKTPQSKEFKQLLQTGKGKGIEIIPQDFIKKPLSTKTLILGAWSPC